MREFPPFRLDTVNQCLWRHGDAGNDERISLTPKAYAVLCYLVEHAGRLVTQEELLEALWPDTFVQPEVLSRHILDIRRALGDHPKNPLFIETLPKRGYRFIAPVDTELVESNLLSKSPSRKLVDREQPLSELRESLRNALEGERQIFFITGEPGIGKTALVDEFLRLVTDETRGMRIARGQCVEGYGGKEAYYPMLEALDQLCHGSAGDSVVQTLTAQAPTWLVQFPSLVKREHRETLHREILGATRERMLREIGDALETITSATPLLLVFEDLQWVDHSTVDLISALARRRASAKLMLLATYRPFDVSFGEQPFLALKQELLVHQLCREIDLEPLTEAEVAEFLTAESPEANLPEGLAGLIHRHSGGNPLFIVAALDHLTRRGLISQENGSWRLSVPLEKIGLEVPESLRQMIEARIERLSKEEQRALEVASVAGAVFSANLCAAATNVDAEDFEDLCEVLARRQQMVRQAGSQQFPDRSVSERYEFVHALYREVFYQRQTAGRRTKRHRRIGQTLEALYSERLSEAATELAYHFEEGSDWARAVKYLLLAADTAGRRFEPRQAALILEHALELVNNVSEAERAQSEIEVLKKLATIYSALYDPRAVETYDVLTARAAHYGLVDVEMRALLDMAMPLANFVSTDDFMRALDRVLEAQLRSGPGDTRGGPIMRTLYLCRRMSAGKWDQGDLEECRSLVARVREAGDPGLLGDVQLGFGYFLRNFSEYREAYESSVEGYANFVAGYEDNPHLNWISLAYDDLEFSCLLFLGHWGEALQKKDQRINTIKKNGDLQSVTAIGLQRSLVQIEAMDFAGAQQILESGLPVVASIPAVRRYCQVWSGTAEAGLGNDERALGYLLSCRDDMDQHPMMADWYHRMPLQRALTEVWLSKGELERARVEAEEFLKVTLKTEERTYRALAFEANARLAIAEQDLDRAQDLIAKALHSMEGYEVPLAHWRVHGTAADLHRRLGNRDLAEQHRQLSCATIMKLADSLPAEEPLRQTFLSAPLVRKVLD